MPERKADDISTERLCADAYMPNANAQYELMRMQGADMQRKLLQRLMHTLACFCSGGCCCCCGQIDAEKRDGTEQGLSICSEVF